MRTLRPAFALAALVLAGCGGGGSGGAAAGGTDGKSLFAGTCGSCHALADAGTNGTFGPNLDEVGPSEEEVLTAIRTGPDQMPENLLEGPQADAVAAYVASAAGG